MPLVHSRVDGQTPGRGFSDKLSILMSLFDIRLHYSTAYYIISQYIKQYCFSFDWIRLYKYTYTCIILCIHVMFTSICQALPWHFGMLRSSLRRHPCRSLRLLRSRRSFLRPVTWIEPKKVINATIAATLRTSIFTWR